MAEAATTRPGSSKGLGSESYLKREQLLQPVTMPWQVGLFQLQRMPPETPLSDLARRCCVPTSIGLCANRVQKDSYKVLWKLLNVLPDKLAVWWQQRHDFPLRRHWAECEPGKVQNSGAVNLLKWPRGELTVNPLPCTWDRGSSGFSPPPSYSFRYIWCGTTHHRCHIQPSHPQ